MKIKRMYRVYRARPMTKGEFYKYSCECNCMHVEVACVPWLWVAKLISRFIRDSFVVYDEAHEEGAYDDSFDHMLKTTFPTSTAKTL